MNDLVNDVRKVGTLQQFTDFKKKWDVDSVSKMSVKNSGEIMKYAPTLQPANIGHSYLLTLMLAARVETEVKDKDQFADVAGGLLLEGQISTSTREMFVEFLA